MRGDLFINHYLSVLLYFFLAFFFLFVLVGISFGVLSELSDDTFVQFLYIPFFLCPLLKLSTSLPFHYF